MVEMRNSGSAPLRFRIAGRPGEPVHRYEVAPGELCEVPESYAYSEILARIAPGLVPVSAPASSSGSVSSSPAAVPAASATTVPDRESAAGAAEDEASPAGESGEEARADSAEVTTPAPKPASLRPRRRSKAKK